MPTELVQKAPLPIPQMRVLTDVEHHKAGDGLDIEEGGEVQMGQPLRVEFSLQPETGLNIKEELMFIFILDAFGFLVRNCVVRDQITGAEHEVIDHKG